MKRKWISITIKTNYEANHMLSLLEQVKPVIGAFDTETNGLHIINCVPFLFQFGFLHPTEQVGFTYAVDLEKQPELGRQVITCWHNYVKTHFVRYLAHNVKYDLHMLANLGLPYEADNLSDTMFYIRYGHDAIQERFGGPSLALKKYASAFIDSSAKYHEKQILDERSSLAKEYNIMLKKRLAGLKPPPEWNAKAYTLSVLQEMFKDPISDYTWLPEDARQAYSDWLTIDVPLAIQPYVTSILDVELLPYNLLNRDNVIKYGHMDIILCLEIYESLEPIVQVRGNQVAIDIEDSLILPLWEMERTGFKCNVEYLHQSRTRLRDYIIKRREDMYDLCQQKFSIGQHAVIKDILEADFNIKVKSTNADELDRLKSDLAEVGGYEDGIAFISALQELRTLEKWYSAYIMRFVKQLVKITDQLYTTINQVGTVSGRVTSDFQQFPKEGIIANDGSELFNPRKLVLADGGDYPSIIYLDYSQIELRFQAFYTILVGHPDLNLCRAYMPYKCQTADGEVFDYTNPDHVKSWGGDWYYIEEPATLWQPTDVHSATTMNAMDITPDHPDFKKLRTLIGKKVNFMKNYGAQLKKVRQVFPDYTMEECIRINDSYYKTFPGVKQYHDYCYRRAAEFSYTENLFGVKYYGVSGHKLINQLVQGSSAFYLKKKIREAYDYTKKNKLKSPMQMNIHDEISWKCYTGEEPIFFEFKQLMEEWPDTYVPIVAEMDMTTTSWADKKGVHSLEDMQIYLSL